VNIPRDKTLNQLESTATWLVMLGRFGRLLFSLAIIGIGVETLICSYVSSHSLGPHYEVVPVIPWLPAIPSLAYLVGASLVLCGAGLLFQRTLVMSSITLGALMLLCGLAFDVPRRPNLMSAEWRTNVLEPIAIGSLACLAPGLGGIPIWLHRTSRYLLAFALIVFGMAHFQVLTFIASLVPGWIPWHSFWTVFFGVAFISAGVSFATGFLQRWAALGVGLMFALWTVTIHIPPVLNFFRIPGAAQDPDKWSDVFIVAALWGGSWALARDLRNRKDLSLGADPNRA
jgi:putative oxidoreductase